MRSNEIAEAMIPSKGGETSVPTLIYELIGLQICIP